MISLIELFVAVIIIVILYKKSTSKIMKKALMIYMGNRDLIEINGVLYQIQE